MKNEENQKYQKKKWGKSLSALFTARNEATAPNFLSFTRPTTTGYQQKMCSAKVRDGWQKKKQKTNVNRKKVQQLGK